jgi:PAS domain S-box-containing protein
MWHRAPRTLTLPEKFALLGLVCTLGVTLMSCVTGAALLRRHLIRHDAAMVSDLVSGLITRVLPRSYFEGGAGTASDRIAPAVAGVAPGTDIVRLNVYDRQGVVLWSDDAALVGRRVSDSRELAAALRGELTAGVFRPGREAHHETLRGYARLAEIYVPVRYGPDGPVVGALEIYRHPPALFTLLDRALMLVWALGGGGGLVLYVTLFGLVRQAARSESVRQHELASHARTLEQRVARETSDVARKTGEISLLAHQMKAAEEFFENLIESSVDAIVTMSPRGRITFVSEGGRRMFGHQAADMVGVPVGKYWVRCEEFRALRRLLAGQGRVQNYETEVYGAGGRAIAVNISASRLQNAAGSTYGVVAVVKDVTALKRLQAQMIGSERLAATGLLAAGVAHEIGNAVTCVSSLCQMLAGIAVDPKVRQGLRDVQGHTDRISRTLEDLTRLSRPRPVEIRETALGELIDTAVRLARHSRGAHRMNIVATVAPSLPTVRVSADHVVQVFINLILNAAESGGDLSIAAAGDEHAVRVEFRDTGCGMSADQIDRLFDPFSSTKEGDGHLGLGMFVCREIIRHHQGRITVESRPGGGSTVTVTLPLHGEPPSTAERR